MVPETVKLEPETIFRALSAAVKLPDRMILPPLPTNLFAVLFDRVIAGPTLAPLLSFAKALSVTTSAEFAPKTTLFLLDAISGVVVSLTRSIDAFLSTIIALLSSRIMLLLRIKALPTSLAPEPDEKAPLAFKY